MNSDTIAKDIKTTILELIADINGLLDDPFEQADFMIIKFFFEQRDKHDVAQHVVSYVLPYKRQIQRKDQNFFLENTGIFQGLPEDKIEYYSQMIASDKYSEEDREVTWQYFSVLVHLAEEYKKNK